MKLPELEVYCHRCEAWHDCAGGLQSRLYKFMKSDGLYLAKLAALVQGQSVEVTERVQVRCHGEYE